MTEHEIQNAIIRDIGSKDWCRIWRNNSGSAKIGRHYVKFGVNGQADISGILSSGVRLEIEVKTATGRQSQDQKNFQAMIEKYNGVYILARSVEDVYIALRKKGYLV